MIQRVSALIRATEVSCMPLQRSTRQFQFFPAFSVSQTLRCHLGSRKLWRRDSLLRRLLERERQRDQLRLAARRAGEAHVERRRLRIEPGGKRERTGALRHWHEAVRHRHRRIARARRDAGAAHAGKEQRVEAVRLERGVDAVRRRQQDVLATIRRRSGRGRPADPSRPRCRGWPGRT